MSVLQFPKPPPPDMRGPERIGCDVIIENRRVPNLHMHDRGDTIDFVLDGRMMFGFPKEWAYLAATFAANAMAIGAGWPCLTADKKCERFAPECFQIEITHSLAKDHSGGGE